MQHSHRDPEWYVPIVERHRAQVLADLVAYSGPDAAHVLRRLAERLEQEARRVATSRTGSWRAGK